MRSDTVKRGFACAPHYSLLRATGAICDDGDVAPAFTGVCKSHVDPISRHVHLHAFGQVVREAVSGAGNVPFVVNHANNDHAL